MTTAALFLAAFAWFAFHAVPSVYFGDNGELLAAAHTGGVPHPTGFPLFLLLTILPARLGTFGANLTSAAVGAGAVTLFHHWALRLFGRGAAWAAVVVFFGSCTLTLHASMARVYTFQLATMMALMLAVTAFRSDRRWGLLAGFLLGLSATVHTLFLLGVVFAVVSLWGQRKECARLWPWLLAGCLLSLSLYLWVALRSHSDPPVNWGHPGHWDAFRDYVTQKNYSIKKFARDGTGTFLFLRKTSQNLAREWNPLVWLLAMTGIWAAWKTHRARVIALCAVAFSNFALMYAYGLEKDLAILYRYFLPFYAVVALLAGRGALLVWNRWAGTWRDHPTARAIAWALLAVLCVGYPAWRWSDMNRSTLCHRYAQTLLRYLPRGATAILSGDNQLFPVAYGYYAKGWRNDLRLVDITGVLSSPEARRLQASSTHRALEEDWFKRGGRQLYVPNHRVLSPPYTCRPWGLVFRVSDQETENTLPPPPPPDWVPENPPKAESRDPECLENLSDMDLPAAFWAADQGDVSEALKHLHRAVSVGRDTLHTLINAAALASRVNEDSLSEKILLRALRLQPNFFEAHLNLGIHYGKMTRYDESRRHLTTALSLRPGDPVATSYMNLLNKMTGRR